MSALSTKSFTELRTMAHALEVPDIFQMDRAQLQQAIELRQQAMIPAPKVEIPRPEYDARLMTKPPAKKSDQQMVEELLAPFVQRGMHLRFDDERWYMSHGKKSDQGTLRMPPRVVLYCAEKLMK
jgi:hypothetical protein